MRNWHVYKPSVAQFSEKFLYAMQNSINGILKKQKNGLFNHLLQIFQPVRKTDLLHKPNFYSVSFHLVLFCPYCVKVISHNKGCLPVTQSMKVTIEAYCAGKTDCSTTSAIEDLDLYPGRFQGSRRSRRWKHHHRY